MTRRQLSRIINKTYIDSSRNCWLWQGAKVSNLGYGVIVMNKERWLVHRLMYHTFVEDLPKWLVIDHLCREPSCVNPEHLEAVSQRENLLRGKSTLINVAIHKTHCPQGHEYTSRNTYLDNNKRKCKECKKLMDHKRYIKKIGGRTDMLEAIYD